jgi:hypothetical protein
MRALELLRIDRQFGCDFLACLSTFREVYHISIIFVQVFGVDGILGAGHAIDQLRLVSRIWQLRWYLVVFIWPPSRTSLQTNDTSRSLLLQ